MSADFSSRRRKGAGRFERLALAGSVLLLVASAIAAVSARSRALDAQRSAERVRTDLRALEERRKQLEGQRPARDRSQQVLLSAEAAPPHIVALLADLMNEAVRLAGLTLSYQDRLRVDLRIEARSSSAHDRFLDRLAASPLFEDLAPGSENRDGEVAAPASVYYKPPGGSE